MARNTRETALQDGDDNTVPDSRWSCEPSLAESAGNGDVCEIQFDLGDTYLEVDHIMLCEC